jgi:hypothetical protein
MEILRVAPYSDINVSLEVPPGFLDESVFTVTITDLTDLSKTITQHEAISDDLIQIQFPGKYDNSYRVELFSVDVGQNVLDETYEVTRPYVDPSTKGTTASEIAEYAMNEELARLIIDSVVSDGFYYKKKYLESAGVGSDYFPVWVDAKKILKVFENNVLVYDSSNPSEYERVFEFRQDLAAIVQYYPSAINRSEGASLIIPVSASDTDVIDYYYRGFAKTFDYSILVEHGYFSVPLDIKRATEILVEDIACGKLDYYKRYISDYSTDQFKIKFDSQLFGSTGNLIVDKILSKYQKSITRPGML